MQSLPSVTQKRKKFAVYNQYVLLLLQLVKDINTSDASKTKFFGPRPSCDWQLCDWRLNSSYQISLTLQLPISRKRWWCFSHRPLSSSKPIYLLLSRMSLLCSPCSCRLSINLTGAAIWHWWVCRHHCIAYQMAMAPALPYPHEQLKVSPNTQYHRWNPSWK